MEFEVIRAAGRAHPQRPLGPRSRPLALVLSLLFHTTFIAAIVWLPPNLRTLDKVAANSEETPSPFSGKKIIWYRFNELPRVAPSPEMTRALRSQAPANRRDQTILTEVPPSRDNQFVWTPVERAKLEPEPRLPDVIQTEIPEPPRPKPAKLFQPPRAAAPETPKEVMLAEPQVIQMTGTPADSPKLPVPLSRAPHRAFVPPPGKRTTAAEVDLMGAAADAAVVTVTASSVTGVALNLTPLAVPPVAPVKGSRVGDASSAPIKGLVAAGLGATGGLPGLAVEGKNTNAGVRVTPAVVEPVEPVLEIVVYQTARLGPARNSLSVPLRPFARTVPPYVEAQFAGRDVYTLMLPMPGMDEYGKDWVLWFGERSRNPAIGRVKAPLPNVKRRTRSGKPGDGEPVKIRALVVISTTGRVSDVKVLSVSSPHAARQAEEDLQAWEFTPATRDGQPIETDALVEFTLRAE